MNYSETLDYLYAQLPMFHRVGAQAYKPSLDNTIALAEKAGNPHLQFKSIHVAGTNGKGSSSHFLSSILQDAGYKTGLYTSPHLKDFRERIKINGEMISETEVVKFVESNKQNFREIRPSFFEMCVIMAFDHFAKHKVDIAVIEVGMGGRLDSTNIILPEICLITNISMDHMQFLGDRISLIAAEKAGIIKTKTPIIISETQEESKPIFERFAKEKNSDIYFADDIWEVQREKDSGHQLIHLKATRKNTQKISELYSSLPGNYQTKNIAGVLQSIEILKSKGYTISEENIFQGIKNVKDSTQLRGRWDMISKDPLIIADTGHNEDGITEVLRQLKYSEYNRLHWVWGMVSDKDHSKILKMLPKDAHYYFCKPNLPRGLDIDLLHRSALEIGLKGESYKNVQEALKAAKERYGKGDLILVGGSTFVVAEII